MTTELLGPNLTLMRIEERLVRIEERLTAIDARLGRPRGRPAGIPMVLDVEPAFAANIKRLAKAQTESFTLAAVCPRAKKATQMRAAQVLRELGFRRARIPTGDGPVWMWTNDALEQADQECHPADSDGSDEQT